jgi:CBS domain containing-hemolysin-like protein
MERGLVMLAHSVIIGFILYFIMLFGIKQPQSVAENRSLLLFAVILIYMILFGHGLPKIPINF